MERKRYEGAEIRPSEPRPSVIPRPTPPGLLRLVDQHGGPLPITWTNQRAIPPRPKVPPKPAERMEALPVCCWRAHFWPWHRCKE
jgi:hypothetical protein